MLPSIFEFPARSSPPPSSSFGAVASATTGRPRPIRVAVHQSNFLPRLKVLQKIARADTWIVLDDVQFARREWQNRARIGFLREPHRDFWLTLPVSRPDGRASLLSEILICEPCKTTRKITNAITHAYHRSSYWPWISEYLCRVFPITTQSLVRFCIHATRCCLSMLGISSHAIRASHLRAGGRRSTHLLQLTQSVGASVYLNDSGGQRYLCHDLFESAGIKVETQIWIAPDAVKIAIPDDWWRDISFLDFVARRGPVALANHVRDWQSIDEGFS